MSLAPVARNTLAQRYLSSGFSLYNRIMTGPLPKLQIPNFDNALCTNTPSEWFYEEDTTKPQPEVIELARSVCASCVERVRCFDWGMENEKYGMWGGVTANERAAVRGKKEHDLTTVKELGWI